MPQGSNIFQMTTVQINIFHSKTLIWIFVLKINHIETLVYICTRVQWILYRLPDGIFSNQNLNPGGEVGPKRRTWTVGISICWPLRSSKKWGCSPLGWTKGWTFISTGQMSTLAAKFAPLALAVRLKTGLCEGFCCRSGDKNFVFQNFFCVLHMLSKLASVRHLEPQIRRPRSTSNCTRRHPGLSWRSAARSWSCHWTPC
jgi:hypothetical protein